MFEETIRALKQLSNEKSALSFSADDDNYFDRECPAPECLAQFKVLMADWKEKVRDEEVFCPFCGHAADAQKWWTQEQLEYARDVALAKIQAAIGGALRRDAQSFNQRHFGGGFISISMKVDSRPQHVPIPYAAAAPMRLKIACAECGCRYAVVGAAYFCPSCGANAAELVFDLTTQGIRQSLDAIDFIKAAISDADTAENTCRLIVESALQNAVTAFQRIAEALHARIAPTTKVRRNAFQSLAEGSALWTAAIGHGYEKHLSAVEMEQLVMPFQQRHLLAHTQGIVDVDYIKKTTDARFKIGQRLVIKRETVAEALTLIEKLTHGLRDDVMCMNESNFAPQLKRIESGED
ncbi:hypothetical protein BJI69_18030 [Luteibacter rhizovicinus DSM 16549]|uniref:Uncharacterized protein n=1 Tax=Luteibacter rhizovicinus DSM 16549 TaxID=1440763 RepID=A0A1L3EX36_9GAMM|nr:hypothetical protein [Luteibacter rhizovicinus]APG05615.1 hypothetical protein BJI69_18030 [Luteibacter rhizovicinus DSM 16549]